MRNLLSLIPCDAQGAGATLVQMILAEPDYTSAMAKLREVAHALQTLFSQAAGLMEDGRKASFPLHFPSDSRRGLHSNRVGRAREGQQDSLLSAIKSNSQVQLKGF